LISAEKEDECEDYPISQDALLSMAEEMADELSITTFDFLTADLLADTVQYASFTDDIATPYFSLHSDILDSHPIIATFTDEEALTTFTADMSISLETDTFAVETFTSKAATVDTTSTTARDTGDISATPISEDTFTAEIDETAVDPELFKKVYDILQARFPHLTAKEITNAVYDNYNYDCHTAKITNDTAGKAASSSGLCASAGANARISTGPSCPGI